MILQYLHVILSCSHAAGGRSLAARLPAMFCQRLFHSSVLPRHVDRRSSHLLPHNRASLIPVCKFVGEEGGGLTARRKCKSSLLCPPPPLFFREVGCKRGSTVQWRETGMRLASVYTYVIASYSCYLLAAERVLSYCALSLQNSASAC